jgi:hypothetical protein
VSQQQNEADDFPNDPGTTVTIIPQAAEDVGNPPVGAQAFASQSFTLDNRPVVTPLQSSARRSLRLQNPTVVTPPQAISQSLTPVYGATSLLHAKFSETNPEPTDTARVIDKLIANAAVSRQQELALHTSLKMRIDFDLEPDLAMQLIDMHWAHQSYTFLLTYRPAVMHSLATGGPYVNKLLLNALYLSSSLYTDTFRLQDGGEIFYRRLKVLLPEYIDQPSLTTIVALLIAGSCLVPHGKQSAGWVFCGIAYRMMTDLGLNVLPQGDPIDVEARRRLYWGAYIVDKFQSLFLGRLPVLDSSETNIPAQYLDTFEEFQEWQPLGIEITAQPAYAISSLMILIRLCQIAAKIVNSFYSRKPKHTLRNEIRHDLEQWWDCIPAHLHFSGDALPPHQMTPL